MQGSLEGKVAVVTGASRGIGRAIALEMAGRGAAVAVLYAGNEGAATDVCSQIESLGGKAQPYRCDVADFNKVKQTVSQIIDDFGGIDILVNNAGITNDKLILQMSAEDFDRVIDVNLKGAFYMTRHVYSHMARRRAGRIINITSVAGIMGNAGQANYASAKAGLLGLTKTTAKELAGRGVTCNAIAPGFIQTDMTGALSRSVQERALDAIPQGRMGQPEDVAQLAAFLASDQAGYITGEVIRVDGGLCI